ncbi:MAG: manganese/zinc/iron transport system permease protein [Flavobacteriales bacterium]|jgi:manganese/zinc/iron transport system permease protein
MELWSFFSMQEPNVRFVTIGTMLLGSSAALIGCFSYLRKQALVGDAIAHSILPGICLGFLLSGTKNPLALIIGAVISGWISILAIEFITKQSKIKADSAIGIVLSVFFAIGVMMLTSIQQGGNASQAGLDKYLFGKAASMTMDDVYIFGGIAVLLLLVIIICYKGFKILSFNPDYASVLGLPTKFLSFLLATSTVLAVAVGIQAVGVVLMAALLITPAAAARFWTNSLKKMLILAAIMGAIAGWIGCLVSYVAPAMPTGPWIVISLTLMVGISIIASPTNGLLAKWKKSQLNNYLILHENVLKLFFQLGEQESSFFKWRGLISLKQKRDIKTRELKKGLSILMQKKWIIKDHHSYRLTDEGLVQSKRIVRLHRLWELFLNKRLGLAPDHVHPDAEVIEHLITPELEEILMKDLGDPAMDPHNQQIPYTK